MSEPRNTIHSAFAQQIASVAGTRYSQLHTGADGLFDAVLQLANHQSPIPEQVTSTPEPTEEVTVETQATADAKSDADSQEESDANEVNAKDIVTTDPALVIPVIAEATPTPIASAVETASESTDTTTDAATEVTEEAVGVTELNGVATEVVACCPAVETTSPTTVDAEQITAKTSVGKAKTSANANKESLVVTPSSATAAPVEANPSTDVVDHAAVVANPNANVNELPVQTAEQVGTEPGERRERRGNGEKKWSLGPKTNEGLSPLGAYSQVGVVQPVLQEAAPAVAAPETLVPTETNSIALAAPIESLVAAAENAVQMVATSLNSPANSVVAAGAAVVAASRNIESVSGTNGTHATVDGVSPRTPVGELRVGQNTTAATKSNAQGTGVADGPSSDAIDRARLVQRVSRAFQRLTHDGGTVRIRLHPPSLGAVRVEVQVDGNRMTAKMTAESETARALLQDQIVDLKARLNEQGFQVDRIQVETDRNMFGSGSEQQQTFERFDEQASQRRTPPSLKDQNTALRQRGFVPEQDTNITRTASLGSLDIRA